MVATVAIVALLPRFDRSIAAARRPFQRAGAAASITVRGIPVIALFRSFELRIPALRLHRAVGFTGRRIEHEAHTEAALCIAIAAL
jgi:hypothetical protein